MATMRDEAGKLMLGGLRLGAIECPTPFYIYDVDGIVAEAKAMHDAFEGAPHNVAYAVKANTSGTIVRALAHAGCGADVVSGAELEVALACGIAPEKIVYSGVAKKNGEIDRAITAENKGICAIQTESIEEILRIEARAAALGRRARISLRFNPELDAIATHAHISTGHDEAKFGVAAADIPRAIESFRSAKNIELVGLTTHVGSQFTTTDEYLRGARALFKLARDMCNIHALKPEFLDVGGGFGIDYGAGRVTPPADFIRLARKAQSELGFDGIPLFIEPGRSLVAAHGVVVSSVIQSKITAARRWLMIDAGMNDLIRPALYQARHRIVDVSTPMSEKTLPWRVVGPVCESSDDFGTHDLPEKQPDRVAILDAGAYGFTMASQYNGRALAAEVFVKNGSIAHLRPASTTEAWVKARLES
jgi:diaminopimelate decarboxylase